MEAQSEKEKRKIHRSPGYPAFDLAEAIQKAEAVYKAEKRTATSPEVIASHMGYRQANGPGGRAVSALRQYGLIEESGGKYRISDLGYTLVHYDRISDEWKRAAWQAASKPTLFKELLEEYTDGLPSDATLRNELLNRGFNPGAVSDVVSIIRNTMSLAKAANDGYTFLQGEQPMKSGAADRMEQNDSTALALKPAHGLTGAKTHMFSWPLSKDVTAEVRFSGTGDLSASHFERLRRYLELAKETWQDDSGETR